MGDLHFHELTPLILPSELPTDVRAGEQRCDGCGKTPFESAAVQLEDQPKNERLCEEAPETPVDQLRPHAPQTDEDHQSVEQRSEIQMSEAEHGQLACVRRRAVTLSCGSASGFGIRPLRTARLKA